MQIRRLTSLNEVTPAIVAAWKQFSADAPMLDWDWGSTWWKHYGADHELCLLVAEDEAGRVRGIAPWFVESSATRGRRIKFLGSGHVCSDYLRILSSREDVDGVVQGLAQWLKEANERSTPRDGFRGWDFLSFEGIIAGEYSMFRLRDALVALGHQTDSDPALDCWRVNLTGDVETYIGGLSKNFRTKVRKLIKKYIGAGRTEFAYATTPQQFDTHLASLVALHQKRWTSAGEPGCFASPEFSDFVHEMAQSHFDQGNLLLSQLKIDGQLAGASLGIRCQGTHYMYQTGMDPELGHLNPGWVLNVHLVLHAISNNLHAIDYLRGDEPYKRQLGGEQIAMSKFRVVGNRAGAKMRNKVWQLKTSIKQNGLGPFTWDGTTGSEQPQS